jgi:hypothetical protein
MRIMTRKFNGDAEEVIKKDTERARERINAF